MKRIITYVFLFVMLLSFSACSLSVNDTTTISPSTVPKQTVMPTAARDIQPSAIPVINQGNTISPSPAPTEESNSAVIVIPSTQAEEKQANPPTNTELVRVKEYIPDIFVELKYSTDDNFTGRVIYDFSDAYLRYGTVKKLVAIQNQLNEQGYSLKIWDAYRPISAQFTLWEAYPDSTYVANPYTGHSSHSNGGTVDICIVLKDGTSIELPTGFDDFSTRADRDYSDVSETAKNNALILENAMKEGGFSPYFGEWWHFSDNDKYSYDDVDGIVLPHNSEAIYVPDCKEFISLRVSPSYGADTIRRILVGEHMTILGFAEDFVRVQVGSLQGYVAAAYIKPAD